MKEVKFEKKVNDIDTISSLEKPALDKKDGFFTGTRKKTGDCLKDVRDEYIKFIVFDMFGTLVDWRGTMVQEFALLFEEKGIGPINCEEFVEVLVNAYSGNMQNISEGKCSFATVDELNKIALNNTLMRYQIYNKFTELERDHMWMVWHRLKPWPDSACGLNKIKEQFKTGILSNGNIRLLEDLSENANLEWDIILSGELFRCYKPDPRVYQSAARELKLRPSEIMLVASHKYDLKAAQECGYKTAYIFRPLEFKTVNQEQIPHENEFDFVTEGIIDLAEQLSQLIPGQDRSLSVKL